MSVVCPYCKNHVDNECADKLCPMCGEIVKSPEWINAQVSAYIRFLKKNNIYDAVKVLIWNDEDEEAVNKISKIIGKKDIVVLEKFILTTRQNRPQNYRYVDTSRLPGVDSITNMTNGLIACPMCGDQISPRASSCPHCGNPTGVHVCPKCNSINTCVITGTSKAASIFLWGAFAANKVVSKYECKDCGHKF